MDVIAWLVFEIPYYDVAVQHVIHFAIGTPSPVDAPEVEPHNWMEFSNHSELE